MTIPMTTWGWLVAAIVAGMTFHKSHAQIVLPTNLTLRVGVLQAPPFASFENGEYGGYQIELLDKLVEYANQDGVTLTFDYANAAETPAQYNSALDLVANDCADVAADPQVECNLFDMIVGDYYVNPARAVRVKFTPAWLHTRVSALRATSGQYNLVSQVKEGGGTTCVPEGTFIARTVAETYPGMRLDECASPQLCIANVKEGKCDLYVEDQLQLQYRVSLEPTELALTTEGFNTQYLVWPMKYALPPDAFIALRRWIYAAVANGVLDALTIKHFGSATPTLA